MWVAGSYRFFEGIAAIIVLSKTGNSWENLWERRDFVVGACDYIPLIQCKCGSWLLQIVHFLRVPTVGRKVELTIASISNLKHVSASCLRYWVFLFSVYHWQDGRWWWSTYTKRAGSSLTMRRESTNKTGSEYESSVPCFMLGHVCDGMDQQFDSNWTSSTRIQTFYDVSSLRWPIRHPFDYFSTSLFFRSVRSSVLGICFTADGQWCLCGSWY